MIHELWDFLTTASSKRAREQGYLHHSIALAHRARRCRGHWLNHLQHCHDFLRTRLPAYRENSRVAVFGSGLLLETPPEILCEHFHHIDFVDVVHTKDAKDLIFRFGQALRFRFLELDLNEQELVGSYDYVISANLLSQLSHVLSARLRKKKVNELEILQMAKNLQHRHLDQILKLSSQYLLFSDFELKITDLTGAVLETSPTIDSSLGVLWDKKVAMGLSTGP